MILLILIIMNKTSWTYSDAYPLIGEVGADPLDGGVLTDLVGNIILNNAILNLVYSFLGGKF